MKKYETKQRQMLLAFFKEHSARQYTVEEIAAYFTKESPVSVSAIYRNLHSMAQEGQLAKFSPAKGQKAMYQYVGEEACSHHLHFKCEMCGQIFHVQDRQLDELLAVAMEKNAFAVDRRKTVLYGACGRCQKKP